MQLRVIRNDDEYHAALQDAERLVALDPARESEDADRLEILTLLIEDYESKTYKFDAPDPVDAISFRMEEQGLKQKDLVPLIGSRSRVSEVLARKRPLTVAMIRSLSTGLGIPVEALIQEPQQVRGASSAVPIDIDWKKFPVREMQRRGWFGHLKQSKLDSASDLVRAFLASAMGSGMKLAHYRRKFRGEELDERSYYSTLAWTARVLVKAKEAKGLKQTYDPSKVSTEFLRDIARLSWLNEGPRVAVEFLAKAGIALVVEPKLPNTLIDGAAMYSEQGNPVIGLTLRFDRLDYFWFTLIHELVHIWKHFDTKEDAFVDRIEGISSDDRVEKEANRIARDVFVPRAAWKRSDAFLNPSREAIQSLADELHVHPALVVGRLHFETGKFDLFRECLGQGSVRRLFPDFVAS
jgi:HTH-type transcriptional regulator / antitoxin HigA